MSERVFNSPEELEQIFFDYIDYCDDKKDMPNIAGFCVYMKRIKGKKIHRDTYYGYKEYEGYSDTLKSIDEAIENAVINCKFQKDLMKIAYLNNKCGYSQKVDTTLRNPEGESLRITTVAEADALLADMLNKAKE